MYQNYRAAKSLLSRCMLWFHYQITSVLLGSVRPPKKSEMRFFLEDNGHELPNARWVSTGYLFSEHMFFQWNDMKSYFTKLPGRIFFSNTYLAHHIPNPISKLLIRITIFLINYNKSFLFFCHCSLMKNNLIDKNVWKFMIFSFKISCWIRWAR